VVNLSLLVKRFMAEKTAAPISARITGSETENAKSPQ
jgi:hypothetical protein